MTAHTLGVFDSGVGGLTVVRALQQRLPGCNIQYLGDTARLPYGTKSADTVIRYAIGCVERLLQRGPVDALVIACNTASAHGLSALREHVEGDLPVIGVVAPGARAVVNATSSGPIGVLATNSTIISGRYQALIQAQNPGVEVVARPAPLLVPLAEEGFLTGPIVEAVLDHHLADLLAAKIESLVLGCTHYPILKDAIESWFLQREHSLTIVDSADAAAEAVASALPSTASDGQGGLHVMVTDAADRFTDIANRFLGAEIGLELVDL